MLLKVRKASEVRTLHYYSLAWYLSLRKHILKDELSLLPAYPFPIIPL